MDSIKYLCLALFIFTLSPLEADENEWFVPLGRPPKAAPRRISGGEGFPPLPLPVTPLRRSERKRQPSPPKMIGKVVWGQSATFAYENGVSAKIADWNLCPADVQTLLKKLHKGLGIPYSHETVNLSSFHGDPQKTPVLFFSGVRTLQLDEQQKKTLRDYTLRGGMIIFDSIAGSPYFYKSVLKNIKESLPEYKLRTIPSDHPIYHIVHDVDKVRYPRNLKSDKPFLEGIYVGCRIAVLVSKYGLGCGWDHHDVPLLKKAVFYDVKSANRLGLNILAYAIGYANVAREEAKPELFGAFDQKKPTSEFVFAQIIHGGAWNAHPGAAAALLRTLRQNSSLEVNLKRRSLDLSKADISSNTFLYLTGLDDFQLDAKAVRALRAFLNASGTLFINNALGMKSFDRAVKRELAKVLPESSLAPVPSNHPIYSTAFTIDKAHYTPAVKKKNPKLDTPYLEGISIGGDLRVIYSPYDLEAGWLGVVPPLTKGYQAHSAMQLGANIILYAMTH